MEASQVLALLGPADEKIMHETSRKSVWRYGQNKLVIREGRLDLPRAAKEHEKAEDKKFPAAHARRNAGVLLPLDAHKTAAIFNDMMKEIPSEDAAAAGGTAGPGSRATVHRLSPVARSAAITVRVPSATTVSPTTTGCERPNCPDVPPRSTGDAHASP
jgi:hypothetical protein